MKSIEFENAVLDLLSLIASFGLALSLFCFSVLFWVSYERQKHYS